MTNHRTPPAPIRTHLSGQHTSTVHAHAVIEQAFYPDLGWCDTPHLPFPTFSAIRVLRDRGATSIIMGYNKPTGHGGGPRVRADFTVRECLA